MSIKREATDDDLGSVEGPAKRPKSGGRYADIRFLVQSKNAGAIIGKGGSNINRLRTEFKASVTVPDCPGPERILSIMTDVDTLADILLDVVPKLDDYSHHRTMEFECELRMLLHQSHAGCLIGKGGSRIKELREKTGSQIKIFSNCCPNSTERIVQISGYPNVVVDCVKEICSIISQAPIKGPNKPYDPHHFNPFLANDYGGYEETSGKGRGGRNSGGFRGRAPPPAWRDEVVDNFGSGFSGDRGGRGSFNNNNYGGRGRGIMGQGPGRVGNTWGAQMGGNQGMDRSWSGEGDGGYGLMGSMNGSGSSYMQGGMGDKMMTPMGGPRGMMQGSGMGGFQGTAGGMNTSNRFMGPRTPGCVQPVPGTGELFTSKPVAGAGGSATIRMKIPNDVAGAIIGKGGQRIRKIRRESAATINIEEATPGSNDRIITITGVMNQVQMAQYLMQQSVRDNQGGGGRRSGF